MMLADGTEASVRSLAEKKPETIRAMVERIVGDRLGEGQLDECDLTLRDIQRIKDAFCELLLGVYHERIPYPEDRIARIPQAHRPGGVRPLKIAVRGEAPCDLAPARRAVRAALRPYGVTKDAELVLAFVDDAAMRDLNRRYRRKDRTTDVLSFGQSLRRGAKGADRRRLARARGRRHARARRRRHQRSAGGEAGQAAALAARDRGRFPGRSRGTCTCWDTRTTPAPDTARCSGSAARR